MFNLRFEVPPANLLSMVGRLAVAPNLSTPPSPFQPPLSVSSAQPGAAVAAAAAAAAAAPVLASLAPPQTELDVGALAATLHAKQHQASHAAAQAPGGAAMGAGSVQGGVQVEEAAARLAQPLAATDYELQDLRGVQGLTQTADASPAQVRKHSAYRQVFLD